MGQVFDDAPALTLTSGHAALHQAIARRQVAAAARRRLSRAVTGSEGTLVHPNLVCDVAIGQSTGSDPAGPRQPLLPRPGAAAPGPSGDTLRTRTEVVGLKQNRPRADGTRRGLVALRIQTENQRGEPVLDFWRCPMIPLRDPSVATGHADRFEEIPGELDPERGRGGDPGTGDSSACARASLSPRAASRARRRSTRSRAATP